MTLDAFFRPKSIAIIGASRKQGSLGKTFFDALLQFKFAGKIFPINPNTTEIGGIPCYASIEDVAEMPELVVIIIRKELAIQTVESCGQKGIKNLILISAGFKEIGGKGIKREKKLLDIVHKYHIRMIGPNCMGIINTEPGITMNASFSPTEPLRGNVAFISQSGALGVAVLEMGSTFYLGFSIFISAGNKADLTDSDFLEYLEEHEQTEVITIYQESIEKANTFRKIVSRLTKRKPVIALKAGISKSGARAASSHTGALASSDEVTDAFYKQCGVIRANTFEEFFELAQAFSKQSIPRGKQIAIITNAGGPGILATDAIEKQGLKLACLKKSTVFRLKQVLPEEASFQNPVDMIASANEKTYQDCLSIVQEDKNVAAIIVIIVRPPLCTTPKMIINHLREPLQSPDKKPVFVVLMAQQDRMSALKILHELKLPVYSYPESAVRCIATMIRYRERVSKPPGKISRFNVIKDNPLKVISGAQRENRKYLRNDETEEILKSYGFPFAASLLVKSEQEAIAFQKKLKKPLVLKIESDTIVHKSDVGGIQINLQTAAEIKKAFKVIITNCLKITTEEYILGLLAQEMIDGGIEVIIGLKRDPNYGPIIMFGMGGIHVEAFNDVSFRIAPLSNHDTLEMVKEIKGYKILKGIRGNKSVSIDFIVELLQRLSQLSIDLPQILELDLNPIKVFAEPTQCKIVDSRIRINY